MSGVLHVELNRPKKLNAMNNQFWIDCATLFRRADTDPEVDKHRARIRLSDQPYFFTCR